MNTFADWLRAETEQVKEIVDANSRLDLYDPYANARLRAFKEAALALEARS